MRGVIGIWVAYPMWADAFHDPSVVAPVHRPVSHVVRGRVVDAAMAAAALVRCVGNQVHGA
jgi:hypothetical protein